MDRSVMSEMRKRTIDIENKQLSISLNILKKTNIANRPIETIKNYVKRVIEENTRQNKEKLCECLQKHHNFFSKVNPTLAKAFSLLSSVSIYKPHALIE